MGDIDYRRLFDLSLDLVCIAGLDGFFKRVNPAWTLVMGWSEPELLERPVADFMHPEDRARTLEARANLARGVPVRGLENRYRCKDGSYRWLSWQSSIELGSQRVYAVARDITERRRLDQEQLVYRKLEATGLLAGGMAHDFNNLLASVRLSLDMIPISGPFNNAQREFLQRARESIHGANALTRQLITLAQGDVSARRVIDLKPLLPQIVDTALLGSTIRAEFRIAPDLARVEVDEAQISQAISGIVMNAREATPAGHGIRIEAENASYPGLSIGGLVGDYVRIRIIDEGPGIPADIMAKVFDPYFSTKERGSRKGMGLGLAICRSVLQKHGGSVEIDSPAGGGTVVTCELPLARATPSSPGAPAV